MLDNRDGISVGSPIRFSYTLSACAVGMPGSAVGFW